MFSLIHITPDSLLKGQERNFRYRKIGIISFQENVFRQKEALMPPWKEDRRYTHCIIKDERNYVFASS
jgi:hypothetical protein